MNSKEAHIILFKSSDVLRIYAKFIEICFVFFENMLTIPDCCTLLHSWTAANYGAILPDSRPLPRALPTTSTLPVTAVRSHICALSQLSLPLSVVLLDRHTLPRARPYTCRLPHTAARPVALSDIALRSVANCNTTHDFECRTPHAAHRILLFTHNPRCN